MILHEPLRPEKTGGKGISFASRFRSPLSMRIIIIDDNASIRALLSALLADQGHTVVAALGEGSGAAETVLRERPEMVFLDYDLPGRNGLDILHDINETAPEIDVLFITGSEDPTLEMKAAAEGAAGFIRKPFGQKQIIDEIAQVEDTRRKAAIPSESEAGKPVAGTHPAPAATTGTSAQRTVVIADDNSSIRLLLKGLLSNIGLKVLQTASNGEEAVSAARTHRPTVVCLDVEMPVLTGLDALPLIRAASPETHVVMVTSVASRDFVTRAAAHGARGYILKPVRPAYIEEFMRKLLK